MERTRDTESRVTGVEISDMAAAGRSLRNKWGADFSVPLSGKVRVASRGQDWRSGRFWECGVLRRWNRKMKWTTTCSALGGCHGRQGRNRR